MRYECVIVGGGIAGLQAAIQLGRYDHRVLVVDSGYGRSTLCRSYRNVLGWPDGVSGEQLRQLGRRQAEAFGVGFARDRIVGAEPLEQAWDGLKIDSRLVMAGVEAQGNTASGSETLSDKRGRREEGSTGSMHNHVASGGFRLYGENGAVYEAEFLLLATGLMDRFPELPGLMPCLGQTVYVCPDCDGFEIKGRRTVVLGSGDCGARMALLLRERTSDLVYVNHERIPVAEPLQQSLRQGGVGYHEVEVQEVHAIGDGIITGIQLANGEVLEAERGFLAFGGNQVQSELAGQLGVNRHENGHIWTDARTKMTNRPGIWAAGDVGVHAEQLTVAMGEGSLAAIWMHKALAEKV